MPTLKPGERRALRARAHHLHPVVIIGQHGLTPQVLHEVDVALEAHELVKVRVLSEERAQREAMLDEICRALDAAPVQHLGKLLIVWRPKREQQEAHAARPAKPHGGASKAGEVAGRAPGTARALPPKLARRRRSGFEEPRDGDRRTPRGTMRSGETAGGARKSPAGTTRTQAVSRSPHPSPSPRHGGPRGVPRAPNPRRRRSQPR